MNKNILIVGSLAIVLGAGSYWFNTKAVAVTVVSPEQTRLQVTILATGQVQTRTSTTINTEIAGTVKRLVDEGKTVNTGEILATLDDKDANSLYQQAAANLKAAELKLEHLRHIDRPQASLKAQQSAILLQQAQRQLSHTAILAKTQQTTEEALATAQEQTTLRQADTNSAKLQVKALATNGVEENLALAAIQQAQSQLQQALHRQQRQTITSPFPAIVLERKADAGQYLKQGEPLLTLSPLHQQEIISRLDERWLPQISLNQTATLLADAFPQEKFTATISHIAPSINETRGTIEIRLKSPQWPTFLREGMTVSMELLSQQRAQAMVIPSAALQQSQNQYWLWLAKDGKAVRQNISIGQRAADKVQVISGLANDAKVIISDKPLQAGQKISIHAPAIKGQ